MAPLQPLDYGSQSSLFPPLWIPFYNKGINMRLIVKAYGLEQLKKQGGQQRALYRGQTHFSRRGVVANHFWCARQVVKIHMVKNVSHIPSLVTTVPKAIQLGFTMVRTLRMLTHMEKSIQRIQIGKLMLQSCGDTVDWIIIVNFKISLCQLLDCSEMIVC